MLRRTFTLLILSSLALAAAQSVQVLAPPDRFVVPGEFVTLVFRLETPERIEVRLEALPSMGWAVVRQPGELTLEPGRSTPVAVTVEVPRDALAFTVGRVTLRVDGAEVRLERDVELAVTERTALSLQAPRELTLSPDGLEVGVTNDGNTAERATLELRRGATVLAIRDLELAAGEHATLRFDLREDGTHTLLLSGERAGEVRRSVSVVRFGAPEPEPLTLAGEVIGAIGSSGAWRGSLALRGPLSDLTTLDAHFEAATPRRSFAQVTLEHSTVRVGGGWRDPLRLGMPSGLGVAGSHRTGSVAFAGTLGAADDRLALAIGAERTTAGVRVAGGAGWSEDAPWLAARAASVDGAAGAAGASRWSVATTYRRSVLTVGLDAEARTDDTVTAIAVEARELLGDAALLAASLQVRDAAGTTYADARVPLASPESWNGRLGVTQQVESVLPGELRVAFQAGTRESFARVSLQNTVGGAWRATTGLGVRADATGVGLTAQSGWSYLGAAAFGVDARLVYYPDAGAFGGRVAARYQFERDALNVSLGGACDLGERNANASAAIGWSDGPWRVDVSGGAAYAFDGAVPWSANVTLSTRYAFELAVPDALVELAGGRDLGTIEGRVLADDGPLADVELSVGRYRVRSDADGAFTLEVAPGSYQVAVDVATLPIAYQLVDGSRSNVEVRRRETTALVVAVVRTTVLRGRVLEDRDGDGRADDPPVGVRARLLVTDSQGLRRTVVTDEIGAFVLRGLLPGAVVAALVEVPAGASVVADDERTLRLEPGVPGEVTFFVRPAEVRVQAFTAQSLRVRSVALEVDRVPPGAAPLLRVDVQGEPDAVTVVHADGALQQLRREGDAWHGRVPVPLEQPAGVLAFTVVVRAGDTEATRRGQLIVDPAAAALLLTSDAPVRAGGALMVRLSAYVDAREVTLAHPFGDDVALVEDEPGRWSGVVTVPADTPDAVYELVVRAATADERALAETLRFRVLDP